MQVELLLLFVAMATGVMARRHQHYHYHLGNNTHLNSSRHQGSHHTNHQSNHQNNHQNIHQNIHQNNQRSQKLVTVQNDDNIETFTPYTKHTTGRHVCQSRRTVSHPVKTVQTFCKPTYKKYTQRCNDNQLCTGVKLVYETAYRDVYSTKNTHQVDYVCCPGWTQTNRNSHGCNKPICSSPCQNGGTCSKPDTCSCQKGFKGRFCEIDVDECREHKPCDQICRNVPGGFKCDCRETFILQPDGQSCRKEGEEGPGIEARDLEYELLNKRLFKLESMLNNVPDYTVTKENIEEMNKKMETLTSELRNLKSRIYEIETNQRDIRVMKNKISALEHKANKMDELSKQYENGIKSTFSNRIYN